MEVHELAVGDWILVRGGFGIEEAKWRQVDAFGEKDGSPVVDYAEGDGYRWCYLNQIVDVRRGEVAA